MTISDTKHIDLDRVLEILRRGVRRADVFMGVGLNASLHTPSISHILAEDNAPQIRLVKQELNEEEKNHVANEFGKWVRANGLRELLETFSIFLLELYSVIFLLKKNQRQLTRELNKCHPKKFERMGIGDQIDQMSNAIAVTGQTIKIIHCLNKVRNCCAHRNGVVGVADVHDSLDGLNVAWLSLQPQVREPDGNVVLGGSMFGRRFEKGGMIEVALIERSKLFTVGSEVVLEKNELKEICLCLLIIGQSLFRETVGVAKEVGVLKEAIHSSLEDPRPV